MTCNDLASLLDRFSSPTDALPTDTPVDIILDPDTGLDPHFYIWSPGAKARRSIVDPHGVLPDGPIVILRYRRADDPESGICEFRSSAWSLIADVSGLLGELQGYDGPVAATLTLETVDSRGVRPVLKINGAAAP